MKNEYRKMMEQVSLSDAARTDILEKLEQEKPTKRKVRPLRVALIAACVCLALVGGAFAVSEVIGYVGSVDVEIDKERTFTENGEEVPHDGYKINAEGIRRYPISAFSEEINRLNGTIKAEDNTFGNRKYFEDWNQMEKFLGLDVMNNPVLASFRKYNQYDRVLDVAPNCVLLYGADSDGTLRDLHLLAFYTADSGTREDGSEYQVEVELLASIDTEYSSGRGFSGVYYYDGTEFETIAYTASNGLEVDIVWVDTDPASYEDQPTKIKDHYDTVFVLNGILYRVRCSASDEERVETLEIMKAVLDGFVF